MRLYLDMCALKRPFDDRTQSRIDAEADAVIRILESIKSGEHQIVWSSALIFENDEDPDADVREAIRRVGELASYQAILNPSTRGRAVELQGAALGPLDAIHLAMAEAAGCDVLITCDDRFCRRAARIETSIRVLNPLEFSEEIGYGPPVK